MKVQYNYSVKDNQCVINYFLAGKSKEDVQLILSDDETLLLEIDKTRYETYLDYLYITQELDWKNAKASMKNGLLTVVVPFKKPVENTITID